MSRMEMIACATTQQEMSRIRDVRPGWLGGLARRYEDWLERRRHYRELAALDDRLLEDIGLDRAAVERAYRPGVPFQWRWLSFR